MIGAMRERITLQREDRVSDGAGGSVPTWYDLATVFARVQPASGRESFASGRERFASQQLQNGITHKVTIRHRDDISGATRILWGTRYLNIRSILNLDERNRYFTIEADEGEGT